MRRPLIAHVLNSIGLGGVPGAAWNLIRTLPPDAYDVRVYCLRPWTDDPGRRAQRDRFEVHGVPVRFPMRDDRPMQVIADLCRWMDEDGVDLLHTHSYRPNIYARMAGSLVPGVAVVAHHHNHYDRKWDDDGTLVLETLLAPRTQALVACSRSVAEGLAEKADIPLGRIRVIPNGVDGARFHNLPPRPEARRRLGLPEGAPIVGIIGRICEQKGHDVFLRAAARIAGERPGVVFAIAGAPEDEELATNLRAMAARAGIEGRTFFLGHAPIEALLSAVDLLAMPSRWEGFPLTLGEAMAAGVPVVASAIPPIVEASGSVGAVLIPPEDDAALARELRLLLDDPARRRTLTDAGRRHARTLSWDRSGALLDELYREVLAIHGRPGNAVATVGAA